jgi:hypothetical protein
MYKCSICKKGAGADGVVEPFQAFGASISLLLCWDCWIIYCERHLHLCLVCFEFSFGEECNMSSNRFSVVKECEKCRRERTGEERELPENTQTRPLWDVWRGIAKMQKGCAESLGQWEMFYKGVVMDYQKLAGIERVK